MKLPRDGARYCYQFPGREMAYLSRCESLTFAVFSLAERLLYAASRRASYRQSRLSRRLVQRARG